MIQEKPTKAEMDDPRNAQAGDNRAYVVSMVILAAILTLFMVLGAGPARAELCDPERNPDCKPVDPPEEPDPDPVLPPNVSVDKPSVVVNEGQTATNSGTFYDPADLGRGIDSTTVSIRASGMGTISQSGGYNNDIPRIYSGTWNWSMPTDEWTARGGDLNATVTITATDMYGTSSSTSFSLTVKDGPPSNDSFSSALDLDTVWGPHRGGEPSTTTNYTNMATMEVGEPTPSSSTKDCGNTGVSNSAWFKFTYGGGQGAFRPLPNPNVYYNFDTQGSNFDTVLALYEGSSLGTLNQIECSNDNSLPNWNDNLRIPQSKLSVGKTYYVQLTGTGGARSGKYQLHYEPRGGGSHPKVMTYNIAKGEATGTSFRAVADTIKTVRPDIVLLNEVRDYPFNQAQWVADQSGIPYNVRYEGCTRMGLHGWNGVAILSRYPITSTESWDLPDSDPILDHWCMLKATIPINGLNHHVFSTRFNWEEDNLEQHEAAIDIVRSMPSSDPVIFGGDFNADWIDENLSSNTKHFGVRTGMTDVFIERPDPQAIHKGQPIAVGDRIDYIYYRGPYSVYQTQMRDSDSLGLLPASDHPYVYAQLVRRFIPQPPDAPHVTSTTPTANATGVDPGVNVSATFSEYMMYASINGQTFKLMKAGTTTAIPAAVIYAPTAKKATLNPNANLQLGTKYKVVVSTGARDLAGNALDQNGSLSGSQPKEWFFTVRN